MEAADSPFFDLSPSEKLQLVEGLWDEIAAEAEKIPVHKWQKEELIRRKTNLLGHPASGMKWEQVVMRLKKRHSP